MTGQPNPDGAPRPALGSRSGAAGKENRGGIVGRAIASFLRKPAVQGALLGVVLVLITGRPVGALAMGWAMDSAQYDFDWSQPGVAARTLSYAIPTFESDGAAFLFAPRAQPGQTITVTGTLVLTVKSPPDASGGRYVCVWVQQSPGHVAANMGLQQWPPQVSDDPRDACQSAGTIGSAGLVPVSFYVPVGVTGPTLMDAGTLVMATGTVRRLQGSGYLEVTGGRLQAADCSVLSCSPGRTII